MFLLIDKTPHMARCVQSISIHLMFLLIPAQRREVRAVKDFNTSHVSINHCSYQTGCDENLISIHLMFLLIGSTGKAFWKRRRISIHLMFLLIITWICCAKWKGDISIYLMFLLIIPMCFPACILRHFNTSHVSINRSCRIAAQFILSYFNTSHVSINLKVEFDDLSRHMSFQYISCFY